jgi:hypothetical protein
VPAARRLLPRHPVRRPTGMMAARARGSAAGRLWRGEMYLGSEPWRWRPTPPHLLSSRKTIG